MNDFNLKSFISTESFDEGQTRILEDLFGLPLITDSPPPPALEASKAHVEGGLRAARMAFKKAYDFERHKSPTSRARLERWIVQESHAGQKRPILSMLGGQYALYKPRSLEAELAWDTLLKWFAGAVGEPVSESLSVKARGAWGWVGLIEYRACQELTSVDRYYNRLGLLGALIWAIGGTDATGSNLIAAGEFPTFIDAEMVLVPGYKLFNAQIATEFRRGAVAPFSAPNQYGLEISFGAAGLAGVTCTHKRSKEPPDSRCARCHHVPYYDSQPCFIDGNEQSMIAGFATGLRVIREKRQELLRGSSPLSGFQSATGRVVFRPSAVYALLKDRLFEGLRSTGQMPTAEHLLRRMPSKYRIRSSAIETLIREETRSLVQGDLPRFDLCMSQRNFDIGDTRVARFKLSGLDRGRGRIAALTNSMTDNVCREWESYLYRRAKVTAYNIKGRV